MRNLMQTYSLRKFIKRYTKNTDGDGDSSDSIKTDNSMLAYRVEKKRRKKAANVEQGEDDSDDDLVLKLVVEKQPIASIMLKSRFRMNKPAVVEPLQKPDIRLYMDEIDMMRERPVEVTQMTESILNIKPTSAPFAKNNTRKYKSKIR